MTGSPKITRTAILRRLTALRGAKASLDTAIYSLEQYRRRQTAACTSQEGVKPRPGASKK